MREGGSKWGTNILREISVDPINAVNAWSASLNEWPRPGSRFLSTHRVHYSAANQGGLSRWFRMC